MTLMYFLQDFYATEILYLDRNDPNEIEIINKDFKGMRISVHCEPHDLFLEFFVNNHLTEKYPLSLLKSQYVKDCWTISDEYERVKGIALEMGANQEMMIKIKDAAEIAGQFHWEVEELKPAEIYGLLLLTRPEIAKRALSSVNIPNLADVDLYYSLLKKSDDLEEQIRQAQEKHKTYLEEVKNAEYDMQNFAYLKQKIDDTIHAMPKPQGDKR